MAQTSKLLVSADANSIPRIRRKYTVSCSAVWYHVTCMCF